MAHQAPLAIKFPSQEYCSGLPFPCPVDLPNSGLGPMSSTWQADSLTLIHLGSPKVIVTKGERREG